MDDDVRLDRRERRSEVWQGRCGSEDGDATVRSGRVSGQFKTSTLSGLDGEDLLVVPSAQARAEADSGSIIVDPDSLRILESEGLEDIDGRSRDSRTGLGGGHRSGGSEQSGEVVGVTGVWALGEVLLDQELGGNCASVVDSGGSS